MKKFKDYSIKRKLLTGFLSMTVLMLIIGGMGIFGMVHINNMDTYLYEGQTAPIKNLINSLESIYQIRVDVRGAVISAGDLKQIETYESNYLSSKQTFLEESATYRNSIKNVDTLALFDETQKLFTDSFDPAIQKSFELAKTGDQKAANAVLVAVQDSMQKLYDNYNSLTDKRMLAAKETSASNDSTALLLTVILIVILMGGAGAAVFLGLRISNIISKPISRVVEASNHISLGRVDIDLHDLDSKDETGMLASSFTQMLEGIRAQVEVAKLISNGDFTQTVPLRSNEDALGLALKKIEIDLSQTLQLINTAANQVNSGAEQVSCASQALASGAAEQAAAVEELNASIITVAQQAEQNAVSVHKATEYVGQAGTGVAESNQYMQSLYTAMNEIGDSSQQISKITKLVEDIAFQTNILALNAAVEAARAGNAGKGFAVVADEVRSLAAKSAEAAKQTAELIEKSSLTVSEGTRLASETLKVLSNVSEKSQMAEQSIREIEQASTEQATSIEQITQGLSQVSSVVQTNAATAEESSASSEELAAQAQTLQGEVAKFQLSGNAGHASTETPEYYF
ncbi:methyl-accepting chemotaxis protein [Faecalispora anaeroviscerum]|uniref:methyl-accepting chemotaxis protein n=1 Tax=Faecalispora anaeroviscerum TaxID=2991836 RepID=UPI0024B8BC91|nr:methyl-accepting chemotaxis protein [Faecalispora anaeroviscerum]